MWAAALALTLWAFSLTAALAEEAGAKWTLLVYMAGDNNLSAAAFDDIKEMMEAAPGPEVNVLVQADFSPIYTPQIPQATFRFQIMKGGADLSSLGYDADMGSPDTLVDFIQWGVDRFPAERFALILWNHGLGWLNDDRGGGDWARGVLQDEGSGSFMSIEELLGALARAGIVFDLVEFDACLMGMWEVAGTLHEWARHFSFSEAPEPGDGNPYDRILSRLSASADVNGAGLGKIIVEEYAGYYTESGNSRASATKSLVDASALPLLANGLDRLAAALDSVIEKDVGLLMEIAGNTQAYPELAGSRDLGDFCRRLEGLGGETASQAVALWKYLTGRVVLASAAHSSPYAQGGGMGAGNVDRSTGLAVNFPLPGDVSARDWDQYAGLAVLDSAPAWRTFLTRYLELASTQDPWKARGDFVLAAYWINALGGKSLADVDLYIAEPDEVYAPWMGLTTPNGFFSPDSLDSGENYEVYVSRETVSPGLYIPIINLYDTGPLREAYVWVYGFYLPDTALQEWHVWDSHRPMGFYRAAPEEWDDRVISLLSANYYSDWWIPDVVQKALARAPGPGQRVFWESVRLQKEQRRPGSGVTGGWGLQ